MRTIAHLSDLHFGRVDAAVLEPLRRAIARLAPDVVVVSGDLTQRARASQFRQARAFLDALPRPQIVVPGNHDVPLYNVLQRFLSPLENYRRYICKDLEPTLIDDEIAVVGVNTARSLTFKGGRVSEEQVERVRAKLCHLDESITKIVVTHHPFDLPSGWHSGQIVGRAVLAMRMFAACGADLLLAGHIHLSHAGETTARSDIEGYSGVLVQAGTATSTRARGEANSFNVIRTFEGRVTVEQHTWSPDANAYLASGTHAFERTPRGWAKTSQRAPGSRVGTPVSAIPGRVEQEDS
jgi:3',5'-cyclic AMP phosphodiesterase CpdA